MLGYNYDLQTEAVRKLINFPILRVFLKMSLEDYCIQMKKSEVWYTSFYNTALYGDAQSLEIPCSIGEIVTDYTAHLILGELLYVCNHYKTHNGAMRPSYCLKLKYPLPFSVSYVQLITQQYESRTA